MKAKTLNLYEMWELYKLLGSGFGNEYLADEVADMLGKINPEHTRKSMYLLYKNPSITNPMETGLLFIRGLLHNKYFEFVRELEMLHGRRR